MSELSNDTLKIGISLAILCHCFGLMFLTAPAPSEEDFPMTVIVKLDSAQAAVSEQGQSLGMESVSENSLTEKKVADKKREIYLQYLEDVSLCIHARRFLEPNSHGLIGIALSGGDYTKDLQTHITGTGLELMGARQNMIIAARAAGVQCFDTVYTNLDDMDGFRRDVETIHLMGFDGKSIINPRQINIVHEIFTPTQKDIIFAEKVVKEIDEKKAQGIGVFTVDGKMIDIAFYDGAKRTIELAKASGVYKGDL